MSKVTYGTTWLEFFHITPDPLLGLFVSFRLNQQVEMGQTYPSTAVQPVARSANVTLRSKGQENCVAEE